MGLSVSDYKDLIAKLLPRGQAWAGEQLLRLVRAFAPECQRADAQIEALFQEAIPMTAVDCLPDWERVTGIPDGVFPLAASTIERQQNITAKLRATGGQSKAYYESIADGMGYSISIEDCFQPLCVGSHVGDRLYDSNWAFAFNVQGDGIDDRLKNVINSLKPAHTVAMFNYSEEG